MRQEENERMGHSRRAPGPSRREPALRRRLHPARKTSGNSKVAHQRRPDTASPPIWPYHQRMKFPRIATVATDSSDPPECCSIVVERDAADAIVGERLAHF